MAMEGKLNVLKYLMFFFNLLFWLSGLVLIVIGALIKVKYGEYLTFADNKYAEAALFLIAVGVIVFIIGFLGCCGAIRENYCMVTTFAVVLAIILILEIAAGVTGFVYKNKVKDIVEKTLERGIKNYDNEEGAKKFFDWMQRELKCCGDKGRQDWNHRQRGAPASCKSYTEGCKEKFEKLVQHNLLLIGGAGLGFAVLQVLGIYFACCLMKGFRGQYEYKYEYV